MSSNGTPKLTTLGLLVIRVGIGATFVVHGYQKLAAGPDRWRELGAAMSNIGIDFLPQVWGLMAALTEFLGGVCFTLGLFFRPVTLLLGFVMVIALRMFQVKGSSFALFAYPMDMLIVFLGFDLIGAGPVSIDAILAKRKAAQAKKTAAAPPPAPAASPMPAPGDKPAAPAT